MIFFCDILLHVVWFIVVCLIVSTMMCPFDSCRVQCIDSFTDTVACNDPDSIMQNGVCYGCPVGETMNASTMKCSQTSTVPSMRCVDSNSVLFNNTCYGCKEGYIYDIKTEQCIPTSFSSSSSSSLTNPSPVPAQMNITYTCYDSNDVLNGSTCYSCKSKNGTLNSDLQCETILNAYYPNIYHSSSNASGCENGYFYDYGICYKCDTGDTYKSGKGCINAQTSLPIDVYLANPSSSSGFNPYDFS